MGRPTPWGSGHSSLPNTAPSFPHILLCSRLTPGLAWFRCLGFPLLSLPGSPFGTTGGTTVIPQGVYAPTLLLPLTSPALILRPAFYPLEEGRGCKPAQYGPTPHSLESWPPQCLGISLVPPKTCARGPGCGEPYYQRAPQPHSRRLSPLVLGMVLVSLVITERTRTARCMGILQDHTLLGFPTPYDCHGWPYG